MAHTRMVYTCNIFIVCFVNILFLTEGWVASFAFDRNINAGYGEKCRRRCDYEGGACDITSGRCACANEAHVYSLRTGKCQLGKDCCVYSSTDWNDRCLHNVSDIGPSWSCCVIEIPLGATCFTPSNCTTDGTTCNYGTCTCDAWYYDTRFPWLQLPGGQCLPVAEIGESCLSSIGCREDNSVCVNGICQCDDDKVHENGSCIDIHEFTPTDVKITVEKAPANSSVVYVSLTWKQTGSVADSFVQYTDDPTRDNWLTKRVLRNNRAVISLQSVNATYSFKITARTPDMNNYTSKVYKFDVTGRGCDAPLCTNLDGHCCCAPLHYIDGNSCKQADRIAIYGLKSYVSMTSINVSWSRPAAADKVACYHIRLFPYVNGLLTDTAEDVRNKLVVEDRFNGVVEFNGLVPGRAYDIQVASKLNCDDTNDVFVVKTIAITEPGIPGPISEESDLDPGDGAITIKWAEPAIGEYTHFLSIMVLDGSPYRSQPRIPEMTKGVSTSYYFKKIDIEIRACTEFMNITSCGEKLKTSVTTVGRRPKPLTNLECLNTGPGSITVRWQWPSSRYGEYNSIEVHAVDAVKALTALLNSNDSRDALDVLDSINPVTSLAVPANEKSATFTGLPKENFYALVVYAVNNEGRSERPGSMDRVALERAKDYSKGDLFLDKLNMFMLSLSEGLWPFYESKVPVCSPVPICSIGSTMKKPSRVKVTKIVDGEISLSWEAPKKGFFAGFRAKVQNKGGRCFGQYDFVCKKGCLASPSDVKYTEWMARITPEFIREFRDFPQPDVPCGNYTTITMSRDQFKEPIKYSITGLPLTEKLYVNLTSIGYMQAGNSIVKRAQKPKKRTRKDQCPACSDPRNRQMIEEMACSSDAGSGKFLYRSHKERPKKYDKLLPGSLSAKCSCNLLYENPKFKMAFLKVDTSGLFYVIDYIVSLEREETQEVEAKYKKTCWKR